MGLKNLEWALKEITIYWGRKILCCKLKDFLWRQKGESFHECEHTKAWKGEELNQLTVGRACGGPSRLKKKNPWKITEAGIRSIQQPYKWMSSRRTG